MKNVTFAAAFLIAALGVTTSAQVKSVTAANNPKPSPVSPNSPNATRVRVLRQDARGSATSVIAANGTSLQSHAKSDFNNSGETARLRRTSAPLNKPSAKGATGSDDSKPAIKVALPSTSVASSPSAVAASSTQVYRVGAHDVLDIQLVDNPTRNSTLFTVLDGGLLEYPLAGDPLTVAGLTTREISVLLRQRIKIFDNPEVVVNVRDYASHTVTVTGFVAAPGTKTLRREAMPLYAVLSEAVVLPEATSATITRPGRPPVVVNLKEPARSSILVLPGDTIKVSGAVIGPTEFFFVGGEINSPGQKPYHSGLTLTQAILASGGTTLKAGSRVRVSRPGADGRLVTEEHNLRRIQTGKVPDPVLQKGDRIEVVSGN